MNELAKENERLRDKNDFLMAKMAERIAGLEVSIEYWRSRFIALGMALMEAVGRDR